MTGNVVVRCKLEHNKDCCTCSVFRVSGSGSYRVKQLQLEMLNKMIDACTAAIFLQHDRRLDDRTVGNADGGDGGRSAFPALVLHVDGDFMTHSSYGALILTCGTMMGFRVQRKHVAGAACLTLNPKP